ncbi:hypothetical protein DENSPDRAFT_381504 [Dentipellis sp. KUC8613]|nr:hypothetical protein DENSPDRAFT_381504 [Dentipellis sp. KUC8613]
MSRCTFSVLFSGIDTLCIMRTDPDRIWRSRVVCDLNRELVSVPSPAFLCMAARRLAISSLLCDDDPHPKPLDPVVPDVPDPVILAPHLLRPVRDAHMHHDFPPLSLQSTSWPQGASSSHSPERRHSPLPTRLSDPVQSPYRPFRSPSPSALSPSAHHISPTHSTLAFSPHSMSNSSPPLSRSRAQSSSSFPSTLLNPVSPSLQSPLGGLEALVQAATEERRRLSGGAVSPRRTQPFQTSPSHSPDATHRAFDLVPAHQLSPSRSYLSPIVPHIANHVPDARNLASSMSPVQSRADVEERPLKRKRSSTSRSTTERDDATSSHLSPQTGNASDRPSILPSNLQALMSPEPVQRGVVDDQAGWGARRSSGSWPESEVRRSPSAASQRHSPDISKVEASKLSPVLHRVQITGGLTSSSDAQPLNPVESAKPPDAWSPEHRVAAVPASPEAHDPPRSPPKVALEVAHVRESIPLTGSPSASAAALQQPALSTTIERELEEVAGIGTDRVMDMDVDSAIAEELDTFPSSKSTATPRQPSVSVITQDVEEELLSLVGDRPSPRPQPSRQSHKSSSAKGKSSGNASASTSNSVRHSVPQANPTPSLSFPPATAHPSLPSRSVSAAPVKPERESMPPPSFTPAARTADTEGDNKGILKAEEQPPGPSKKKVSVDIGCNV